ncbi:MAG: 50S ribosomal protein P1 [Archaeoglobaceae archaeon]|nr:50S ribosomal protein P1 [Archaeoglobaceae archaeon]MCX8152180.1 50S ribosomal protein P1 [Archaeoglobaceae archaeon]MDW8013896.1 50S ribosomal protein P1 [Archaeoglobaceae archaeon]
MEYVYAALLLHAAGKEINEENVKAVLKAAGVTINEARVKALVAALDGVNIDEVIQRASTTMVPAVPAITPSKEEKKVEEKKKEEKKKEEEEKKEEEAVEGLAALFG